MTTDRHVRIDVALRVIRDLLHRRRSITDLGERTRLSRRSLYRLLRALKRSGLPVQRHREGRQVLLSILWADMLRFLRRSAADQTEDCRRRVADRYHAYQRAGLCPACGRERDREDRKQCSACRQRYQQGRRLSRPPVHCSICGEIGHNRRTCAGTVSR